jgi:hypothetical protein
MFVRMVEFLDYLRWDLTRPPFRAFDVQLTHEGNIRAKPGISGVARW